MEELKTHLQNLSGKFDTEFFYTDDGEDPAEYFIYEKRKNGNFLWFSILPYEDGLILSVYDVADPDDIMKLYKGEEMNELLEYIESEYKENSVYFQD